MPSEASGRRIHRDFDERTLALAAKDGILWQLTATAILAFTSHDGQPPFHAQAYLRARTSLLLATRTSCKHRFKEISRHIFRKFNG